MDLFDEVAKTMQDQNLRNNRRFMVSGEQLLRYAKLRLSLVHIHLET